MRLTRASLMILMALGIIGCDEKLSDLTGPTPNLQPTFSSIQQNIFEASDSSGRAACTQCHNAVGRLFNGLDLSSAVAYANLVNVTSREKPSATRVIPGDPVNSYLIQKLEGQPGIVGVRMPFSGPPYLTDGQITVIKRWIEIGAPNN
ncbi:MAG TPA: hypothetical protein VKB50_03690 [Vicinamibacterales bacterium]|nr:hypothetical protein [Vicinamibacterales bacterium]